MAACGWCLGFDRQCCRGRFEWCTHGSRCDMTLVGTVKWHDLGETWCYEHARSDWCANKRGDKEGIQMSKVIEEARELLDEEVAKVLAGDPSGEASMRARGMVNAMAVFTGRSADELAKEAVARVKAAAR